MRLFASFGKISLRKIEDLFRRCALSENYILDQSEIKEIRELFRAISCAVRYGMILDFNNEGKI